MNYITILDYTMKFIDFIRMARIQLFRILAFSDSSLFLPETAIIIAPHPDDEVFGCCGLMQRMLAEGKCVELVIMTGGGKSHSVCCDIDEETLICNRQQLTRNAAAIYGLGEEHIHFLNYPDNGVSFAHEQTKALTRVLNERTNRNTVVFFKHLAGAGWSDNIRNSEISGNICAVIFDHAMQYEYCVWFWFYNCWKIDWKNAFTLKLSKQEYDKKRKAIDAYIEPKAPCGKPWSGVLPSVFLWANKWNRELYFKRKR